MFFVHLFLLRHHRRLFRVLQVVGARRPVSCPCLEINRKAACKVAILLLISTPGEVKKFIFSSVNATNRLKNAFLVASLILNLLLMLLDLNRGNRRS